MIIIGADQAADTAAKALAADTAAKALAADTVAKALAADRAEEVPVATAAVAEILAGTAAEATKDFKCTELFVMNAEYNAKSRLNQPGTSRFTAGIVLKGAAEKAGVQALIEAAMEEMAEADSPKITNAHFPNRFPLRNKTNHLKNNLKF